MASKRRGKGKSAVSGFVRSTKAELGLYDSALNPNEPQLYPARRCQNKYVLLTSEQEELVAISRRVLSRMLSSPFNVLFKSSPQDHFIFDETATFTTEFINGLISTRPHHFPKELHNTTEITAASRKRKRVEEPLITEAVQESEEENAESDEEFLELPQEDEEMQTRGLFEDDKEGSESSDSEAVY